MYAPALLPLVGVLGALTFLPRGKGAMILILGGMLVLAVALLWSFAVPRRRGPGQGRAGAATPGASAPRAVAQRVSGTSATDGRIPSRASWIRAILSTAARAGLGRAEFIRADGRCQVIRLTDCKSCRGRERGHGCEHERATLEQVLRIFAPRGRVVEVACNSGPPGACTFELRPGAPGK